MTSVALAHIVVDSIPVVVPLLLAWEKKALDRIPAKWKPFIASAIGPILALVTSELANIKLSAEEIAMIGAAGVGVREMVDQLKQAVGIPPGGPISSAPALQPTGAPFDETLLTKS